MSIRSLRFCFRFIETEDNEKSWKITQNEISGASDIATANKKFELHLDQFGPYRVDYTTNGRYTRGITPKRVTSDGVHLRRVAPGQHSSEETLQRWRAVGDVVSDLTWSVMKPQNVLLR